MNDAMTADAMSAAAVRDVLIRGGFAEHDDDQLGFHVYKAAFGPEVVVELCGVDTLPFNPGEGPRALLDDYAAALKADGYEVTQPSAYVVVKGVAAAEPVTAKEA